MPQIRYETDGPLAIITLANPPQNRITSEMGEELVAALVSIEEGDVRALLVCADGPDFCFGGDITPWPELDAHAMRDFFEQVLGAFNRFEALDIPTIVAVQGLCLGGGLELAARADIVFAGETARFGHPEQSLGIVTVLGGIYRVAAKAGRAKAMEWALTSERVSALEMEQRGVVNRVVPDDRLREEAVDFAMRVANGPTLAHSAHKALLRSWSSDGTAAADAIILDIAMPLFASDDVKMAIPAAVDALRTGATRPDFAFKGR